MPFLPPASCPWRVPNWNNNEECEKWKQTRVNSSRSIFSVEQRRKKKCERLLIGLKHLSEIKGGSTTVLSYQALMVASPSSYTNLNEWPSSDVERAEDVKNKVLI